MANNWTAIIPFLLVIPIAIYTKQVLPGLIVGLLVGSFLVAPHPIAGLQAMITYLVQALIDENNIKIILFLYVFSGMIGMIKFTGGINGFVNKASERISTKRDALLLTYISTIGTFSAPTFRFVTIAPIMKALLKKVNMSSKELAFVIETTATPVIVLIPVATAFVGYMVSVIQVATESSGITADPYRLFIQSIPFNFFAIVIVILGVYLSFFHKKKANNHDRNQEKGTIQACSQATGPMPSRPLNLFIPIILVISSTIFLTWWDGHSQGYSFLEAFINADVLEAMVVGLMLTFLITTGLYLFQRFNLGDLISHFVEGGNALMNVIVLLSIVWGLSSVTSDLGFSEFVTSYTNWIPESFVAPLLFIFGALIAYFIGSAWGTWGILMPLGISLAASANAPLPIIIGTVFASGSFGAFASPLSDDTNTLANILGLTIMDYATYKLRPALIAATITTVLYFIVGQFFY
ncbi:Na+/H+ antiporter NhaC [Amphibacillus marinus]|uniref:Na+/H+ antiporter NhaC n=1 Tax=Amphibacillus marinus TaxID=872970 RepID=A0A1H8QU28_9BACI|nr:Na+/H+ antiporter NhaC family protein [Amphibacillus marinus]SEO57556.1 Na+/H+ antiporter NhaC [Amphibacillus marinus]